MSMCVYVYALSTVSVLSMVDRSHSLNSGYFSVRRGELHDADAKFAYFALVALCVLNEKWREKKQQIQKNSVCHIFFFSIHQIYKHSIVCE